jgi:hypothetical protein
VAAYKDLPNVEQDFKISKNDLDLRPIWHRLEDRVRAHVLIWRMPPGLAPAQSLGTADLHRRAPPQRANPVAPATRSPAGQAKASRHLTATGEPTRSFRDLLDHRQPSPAKPSPSAATRSKRSPPPTPAQRQAFDLLGAPVPITLE